MIIGYRENPFIQRLKCPEASDYELQREATFAYSEGRIGDPEHVKADELRTKIERATMIRADSPLPQETN